MQATPSVLFLCNHNSARSQMAEALLRHHGKGKFEAHSAGLEISDVNPLALKVLEEIHVDTTGLTPKKVSTFLGRSKIDYAIILCEDFEKACPRLYPFCLNVLHWPFAAPMSRTDSENAGLERFRSVRDKIQARIIRWIEEPGA
jgi:arsenate reductase (thioredoxin)